MEKPDVDQIDGLSPAISIDQKGASPQPALDGRDGHRDLRLPAPAVRADRHPALPGRRTRIERQTVAADRRPGAGAAGGHAPPRPRAAHQGPQDRGRPRSSRRREAGLRPRARGRRAVDLAEAPTLDKYKRHSIEVVVDRYVVRHAEAPEGADARRADGRPIDPDDRRRSIPDPDAARLADSVETALRLGEGVVLIAPAPRDGEPPSFEEQRYSRALQLPVRRVHDRRARAAQLLVQLAARRLPRLHRARHEARDRPGPRDPGPRARASAQGARRAVGADADRRVVADEDHGGRVRVARLGPQRAVREPADGGASTTCCYATKDEKVVVRYRHERGENTYKATFEGVVTNLERRYRETESDYIKAELEKFMVTRALPDLRRQAAAAGDPRRHDRRARRSTTSPTTVDHGRAAPGRPSCRPQLSERERDDRLPGRSRRSSARLGFLVDVGLDYLTLDRTSVDAVGRRGPADPPRDPDRDDADGRPLHPRRAVDRAAPARQRG